MRAEYGSADEEEDLEINCGGCRGSSMSASACLHSLKKCAIYIHRGSNGFLARKINLDMLDQTSKDHPVRKISTRNQEVLESIKSMMSLAILTLMPFKRQ